MLHVQVCYMYKYVTCTSMFHVQVCYMYKYVTCTSMFHVQVCYMYKYVTCTSMLHVQVCYMYKYVTCTSMLHAIDGAYLSHNKYGPPHCCRIQARALSHLKYCLRLIGGLELKIEECITVHDGCFMWCTRMSGHIIIVCCR